MIYLNLVASRLNWTSDILLSISASICSITESILTFPANDIFSVAFKIALNSLSSKSLNLACNWFLTMVFVSSHDLLVISAFDFTCTEIFAIASKSPLLNLSYKSWTCFWTSVTSNPSSIPFVANVFRILLDTFSLSSLFLLVPLSTTFETIDCKPLYISLKFSSQTFFLASSSWGSINSSCIQPLKVIGLPIMSSASLTGKLVTYSIADNTSPVIVHPLLPSAFCNLVNSFKVFSELAINSSCCLFNSSVTFVKLIIALPIESYPDTAPGTSFCRTSIASLNWDCSSSVLSNFLLNSSYVFLAVFISDIFWVIPSFSEPNSVNFFWTSSTEGYNFLNPNCSAAIPAAAAHPQGPKPLRVLPNPANVPRAPLRSSSKPNASPPIFTREPIIIPEAIELILMTLLNSPNEPFNLSIFPIVSSDKIFLIFLKSKDSFVSSGILLPLFGFLFLLSFKRVSLVLASSSSAVLILPSDDANWVLASSICFLNCFEASWDSNLFASTTSW